MAIPKEKYLKEVKYANYTYISKQEMKEYLEKINKRFEISYDFYKDYVFVRSSDKIWIMSKDVLKHDLRKLRIEGIGFVFGRIIKGDIKLTTNAVQLFGKYANKNVFELTNEEEELFIRGLDLNKFLDTTDGYVILKNNHDYLGLGKYISSQHLIKNLVPKARRIKRL